MSVLDDPIDFSGLADFFPQILAGAGVGLAASYAIFKTPSLWEMVGFSTLGGLGAGYLTQVDFTGATAPLVAPTPRALPNTGPTIPTFDLPGMASQLAQNIVNKVENIVNHPPAPAPAKNPLGNAPTSGGSEMTGNFLTPDQAYTFIHQGRYTADVRSKHLSRYYTWKDVIEPILAPVGASRAGQVALAKLKNAYLLALQLDLICDKTGGKKIPINSWIRIQTRSSNHTTGAAADLGASYSYCNNVIKPAAKTIPGIKAIGYPTKKTQNAIHIDILANHGCPAGKQYVFIDNGDGIYAGSCQAVVDTTIIAQKNTQASVIIPPANGV